MSRLATDLVGFETIVRREVMRILRIWAQTILPPAITMTLCPSTPTRSAVPSSPVLIE